MIVDSTVQEKAIAFPTGSRLLEIARHHVVKAAKAVGIVLKQTSVRERRQLRRRAGGYAHARQFKRLHRVLKRQRTVLGILLREVQRKLAGAALQTIDAARLSRLTTVLERAERLRVQKPRDKDKLYAMHAPEVECIGKGKARQPYEFGVKASIAITHRSGLVVGARKFPGTPYDGHTLWEQLEQTAILLEGVGAIPRQVVANLGYRGVDAHNPGIEIIHRGRHKSLTQAQRRWRKRRQVVEEVISHLKADHRMGRCWRLGSLGDALHAVLCAAGYNLRWLLRAIARKALKGIFCASRMRALEAHGVRVIVAAVIARTHEVTSRSAALISRWLSAPSRCVPAALM